MVLEPLLQVFLPLGRHPDGEWKPGLVGIAPGNVGGSVPGGIACDRPETAFELRGLGPLISR
jgi:hypothetical protein